MTKGRGQKVNRAELSAFFGVSLVTVDAWVKAGCPFDERGNGTRGSQWKFDTADVAAWRVKRAVEEATGDGVQDKEALANRKKLADTRLAELELAKALEQVAPLDQVERALSKVFAEIRAKLGNLPGRVAPRLVGENDERVLKSVLAQEIDAALEVLADLDVLSDDNEDDTDGDA